MMERLWKTTGRLAVVLGIIITGLLSGCKTGPRFSDLPPEGIGNRFHLGDQVTVTCVNPASPTGSDLIPAHSERIGEEGTLTLDLIGSIVAVGKTPNELQKEIRAKYVPKYFPDLNVTVKGETRYFYVDGEVGSRGAKEYPGEMTIVKAISVAGGFTDFAKKTKVRLTRAGRTETINVEKAIKDPKYDVQIFPGDTIHVPRRIFW
jgi:protein involved in polysaccharide export with SLBB domain